MVPFTMVFCFPGMAAICALLDTLAPGEKVKSIEIVFSSSNNFHHNKHLIKTENIQSKVVASNQLYGGTLAQIQALPNRSFVLLITLY